MKKYGNLEFGNPNILFWEGVIWEGEFRTSQKKAKMQLIVFLGSLFIFRKKHLEDLPGPFLALGRPQEDPRPERPPGGPTLRGPRRPHAAPGRPRGVTGGSL